MGIAALLLVVAAGGLGGYAVLSRLGLDHFEAWAGGRTAGLAGAAMAAWWLGVAGLTAWRAAGAAVLLAGALWGAATLWRRRPPWRQLAAAEAVTLAGTAVVLLLRLPHPEILGTEKPMDSGILASLLRAPGFPPPDMWLAGEALPYYYWGALLWAVPLAAARVPLELGYNLVAASLGGLLAGLAWAVGRRLAGGSHVAGALATFLGLFAGTPDGLRQLLGGRPLGSLDLWASSRQVPDTITEFPLFTLWLGDLHPHLLSLPLQLLAVLVAAQAGRERLRLPTLAALAALVAGTWAANPWALPPTAAAVGLLLVAGEGSWVWPSRGEPGRRWVAAAAVPVAAWLLSAPFQLSFEPPLAGLGLAHAWTRPLDLLLYAGPLLVPAFAAALTILPELTGGSRERSRALTLAILAASVLTAAVSGRPTLVLLSVALAALAAAATTPGADRDRPALALAALGLFLLVVPELLYVRDPYGPQLHRMNTVFKAYIQGWLLLAVAAPVLLRRAVRSPRRRLALAAVSVLPTLPHLLGLTAALAGDRPLSLDGLRWMDPGDRAMVRFLRQQPAGTTLVEAVGDAYGEHGRLSAASGVPAVLGWANHEGVWRGGAVGPELERRRALVSRVYSSPDPAAARAAVVETGADLVALGWLERRTYPEPGLAALLATSERVFEAGGAALLRPAPAVPPAAVPAGGAG